MPENRDVSTQFGFRFENAGVHTSRTMMVEDLSASLRELKSLPAKDTFSRLVKEENILGKRTTSNRIISYKKLCSLYGFDDSIPIFRVLRELWRVEESPLTASLVARARDPVFDTSYETIKTTPLHTIVESGMFERDLRARWSSTLSDQSLEATAIRVKSSWSQAGYLEGLKEKRRIRPQATKTALTLALWMAFIQGYRDQRLLESRWVESLELDQDQRDALLEIARRHGLIEYRNAGGIIEIRLDRWFTSEERSMLHA